MKRFFCLDGHSLIYRACYSPAPMLRSARGEPTKGPYIFLRVLQRLVRDWAPIDYLVVTLDSPRETLRKRLVDGGYKNHRGSDGLPEDVKVQFRLCLDMLRELGIPNFAVRGWEADDLLAALTRKFRAPQLKSFVVTSDKDLQQLVSDNVFCLDIFSGKLWDKIEVELKWGVPPEQVLEVQALTGDATDGVRGVRGIGPKRAAELVQLFGSAQAAHASVGKIMSGDCGSRRGAKSLAALKPEDIQRIRTLVSLDRKAPVPFERIDELAFRGLDLERARTLFNYLGFRQWESNTSSKSSVPTRSVPGFNT